MLDFILESCRERRSKIITTPNAEIANHCLENPIVMEAVQQSSMIIPDGAGVVIASKILKTPLRGKVAGVEIATKLLPLIAEKGLKLYLFGGRQNIARAAKQRLLKKYPDINVCGFKNGYFDADEEIAADINLYSPDAVFVCLGTPRQELFMANNRHRINCGVMIGLGGTIDILAGRTKRAPQWMVKLYLEWLYRLLRQPARFIRMLAVPSFLIKVRLRRKELKKQNRREKISGT